VRLSRSLLSVFAASCLSAPVVSAQVPAAPPVQIGADSLLSMLSGSQRAKTTRADLETSLREIEAVLGSSGYSSALKSSRRAEAEMIRQRLAEGDVFAGDVLLVQVSGDPRMNGAHPVTPRRTVLVPGAGEISVANLLRSELEAHLTTELGRFVRNPTVRAEALLRLQISGSVARPGFFTVPASMPLPDVLMQFAGGPTGTTDLRRSSIRRGGDVVLPGLGVETAIREARSVDALNLQAGDELRLEQRPAGGGVTRALAVVGSLTSVVWLLAQVL